MGVPPGPPSRSIACRNLRRPPSTTRTASRLQPPISPAPSPSPRNRDLTESILALEAAENENDWAAIAGFRVALNANQEGAGGGWPANWRRTQTRPPLPTHTTRSSRGSFKRVEARGRTLSRHDPVTAMFLDAVCSAPGIATRTSLIVRWMPSSPPFPAIPPTCARGTILPCRARPRALTSEAKGKVRERFVHAQDLSRYTPPSSSSFYRKPYFNPRPRDALTQPAGQGSGKLLPPLPTPLSMPVFTYSVHTLSFTGSALAPSEFPPHRSRREHTAPVLQK
ncbi:hypothetical protein BDK51DRAFT_36736 [Blyttiomyces helicus]|uniref:Uncharacterized protein n=1 Tax=Blyttiomyces helicus TaxID=388810 RepID=A0A4P9WPE9_9FUNG|nr:hypothetical protein BDK51DRAFT_36736 [Blyttiomyces helicus]|eukprot:RKO94195.1 hypothetical protein BDK51DRAFT_36736 [Blyttiomyces helicus]